jgi:DNA-binding NtrC family response regulator
VPTALLVDDDRSTLDALTTVVEKLGFSTIAVSTWADAKSELLRQRLDVALLDVFLPGGSGLDLLLEIPKERRPQVVLISGDESLCKAFTAMPMHELHFVQKPVDSQVLERTLGAVRRRCRTEEGAPAVQPAHGPARLLGDSPAMRRLRELIAKVAPLDMSVYIEGESGTGKELVARAIHELSSRSTQPFIALNCGALPETLIDSELFGYEKGAFTGAQRQKPGVFEQAHGGTLFLDEIAEMPVNLQVRLLRTLESRKLRRVGGEREIEVDARIVVATNRRFEKAIAEGLFREDLFHRLCVFPIATPPLRARPEDIEPLARHFLAEIEASNGRAKPLEPETLERIRSYRWPGNVRQLRNAIQRAYVVADQRITVDCLPPQVIDFDIDVAPESDGGGDGQRVQLEVGTSIADAERRLIEATLRSSSGDKRLAAEILGVSLRTLYNRLRQYAESGADKEPVAD